MLTMSCEHSTAYLKDMKVDLCVDPSTVCKWMNEWMISELMHKCRSVSKRVPEGL